MGFKICRLVRLYSIIKLLWERVSFLLLERESFWELISPWEGGHASLLPVVLLSLVSLWARGVFCVPWLVPMWVFVPPRIVVIGKVVEWHLHPPKICGRYGPVPWTVWAASQLEELSLLIDIYFHQRKTWSIMDARENGQAVQPSKDECWLVFA